MNKTDRADVREVDFKVNGITFESVRLRRSSGLVDFDVLIDDPHIGRFACEPPVWEFGVGKTGQN